MIQAKDVIGKESKYCGYSSDDFLHILIEVCWCYSGDWGYMYHTGSVDEESDGNVVTSPSRTLGSRMLNINRDIREVAILLGGWHVRGCTTGNW